LSSTLQTLFLVAVLVVPLLLAGGLFWMWYRALHDEVGPALVASGVSLAVIVGVLLVGLKLQEPPPPPPSDMEWE
jgi:preprotein translocase subunit SecY